jgi:hypothetical protein
MARCQAARDNRVMEHLSRQRLDAGLDHIRASPRDGGRVILVVRRPEAGTRELPKVGLLDPEAGLAGDNWLTRGSASIPDGSADPDRQITVMNARAAHLVACGTDRMPLAGDQLYVDLDLSVDNLPSGSLLMVGQAVLRVSEAPHLVREVRRTVRRRRHALCQLPGRAEAAAARDEHPCRAAGHRPLRRHRRETARGRSPILSTAATRTTVVVPDCPRRCAGEHVPAVSEQLHGRARPARQDQKLALGTEQLPDKITLSNPKQL